MSRVEPPILALDPASATTGYAVLRPDGSVIEAGRLRSKGRPALLPRVEQASADLSALIDEYAERDPATFRVAVVEIPSPKSHGRVKRASGAGLAVYGFAVGNLYRTLIHRLGPHRVVGVTPEQWAGSMPKDKRNAALAYRCPQYAEIVREGDDPGGDVGDAICLGQWWIRQRQTEAMSA